MDEQIAHLTRAFVDGRAAAELDLEFGAFVAATYGPDAVYAVAYGGVVEVSARGRDEILATHYGWDTGQLSPALRDSWVAPMKKFLVDAFS